MTPAPVPFSVATMVSKQSDGEYGATLDPGWAVGDRPHGGYLLAVMTRAALDTAGLVANSGAGDAAPDPLVVSAQFLRPPACGPAVVHTAVRRSGRTVTVVTATLEEDGRPCADATITCGVLPDGPQPWLDVPAMPALPPPDAVDLGADPHTAFRLATACRLRLDAATAGFITGRTGLPPRIRGWVRPAAEQPDPLFALVAGDISPPVVFNLGYSGWSPTVQLTALLRARPAPGWLRVHAEAHAVSGPWFDEDHTVIDSAGRLVCQARQLAMTPTRPGHGRAGYTLSSV